MRADLTDNSFMKEVHVDLDELVDEDTTGEERRLIMNRRHIVVYNHVRKKIDLRDIDEKVNAVRKKIGDMGELKKSLGKMKSFVKFTKTGVIMNGNRIS